MYKAIVNSLFVKKNNILLHGPGGCGKSYMMQKLYKKAKSLNFNVALTGTTGVSALNIGGNTLHSWAGIGIADLPKEQLLAKVKHKDYWMQVDILMIDEIGMLGKETFIKLDYIARKLKDTNKAFGGIKLVISGDFLQLSPINDDFIFECKEWKNLDFDIYILETPYRYVSDESFFRSLLRFRKGKVIERDIRKLDKCLEKYKHYSEGKIKLEIKPSVLYSTKDDVEYKNIEELCKLTTKLHIYEAKDSIFFKKRKTPDIQRKLTEQYQDTMSKNFEPVLQLKQGAQVMLVSNDFPKGLVNGSRGVIQMCNESSIVVLFANGVHKITPVIRDIKTNDIVFSRCQFPLILAWALTIHKCQGSTLDCVIADLSDRWLPENMIYVVLSRCRNIDSIFLKNIDISKIKCNQKALEYNKTLKKKSKYYRKNPTRIWKVLDTIYDFPVDLQKIMTLIISHYLN